MLIIIIAPDDQNQGENKGLVATFSDQFQIMNQVLSNNQNPCQGTCQGCVSAQNQVIKPLCIGTRSKLDVIRHENAYHAEDHIFRAGQTSSGLYCILSGIVALYHICDNGDLIITNFLKSGDFLGISEALHTGPYQLSALCITEVNVCHFGKEIAMQTMKSDPAFMESLCRSMAMEINRQQSRSFVLMKKHMLARLSKLLLELEDFCGTDDQKFINIELKKKYLAAASNMTEANAIRHMSQLKSEGLIDTKDKRFRILNHRKLLKLSNQAI